MGARLGISCGDPEGIGLEVTLKALAELGPEVCQRTTLFAEDRHLEGFHVPAGMTIRNLNLGHDAEPGKVALASLDATCDALDCDEVDAIVTAPLDKSRIPIPGFTGHTGYLGERYGATPLMLLAAEGGMRVALVTEHVALRAVSDHITTDRLRAKHDALKAALQQDFGVRDPWVALLSVNPHQGDTGAMGSEEMEFIQDWADGTPGLEGPFAADGFFAFQRERHYDAVLAMYHDQGLIPFKMKHAHDGVNVTCGLPIVRTSPDHGTAFNIAGRDKADYGSMKAAIRMAERIFLARN